MDRVAAKAYFMECIKKYRYIIVVVLAGIFLMVQPSETVTHEEMIPEATESELDLQTSLTTILSKVSGAGKVEVLLSVSSGAETIYQADEDLSEHEKRQDTVLVTAGNRGEEGLIKQINPPVYLGALVLCQGADSANVRLAIVEAVSSITGLTSDRITVLKMN